MTSAAVSLTEDAPLARRDPSRLAEFLLVGGATLVLFPVAWLARRALGLDTAELVFGFTTFHAAHLVNDPHFAVTYVLFYRDVKARAFGSGFAGWQRARYVFAAFVVPVVLLCWSGVAIAAGSARALGVLMELMFALVGWHYVKQGFGVLVVLSGRRGVRYSTVERRAFLAHALLGWAFAWANPATAPREVEEKGVVYTALAHPRLLELVTFVGFVASGLVLAALLVVKARRERSFPPLTPITGFLVSIWLWSVLSSIDPLIVYVVPALHSLQYLYFVWLLRRNQARSEEGPPHFGRSVRERLLTLAVAAVVLGFVQFHALPELLDAARVLVPQRSLATLDLGLTPWFAALFAVVNIHHYFMDTVIWRRENPETRHLAE